MALTQTSTVDEITITSNGVILYRNNNLVMDGEKQVAQGYERNSITPGTDLTNIPANVVAVANIVWTPEVISAYQAEITAYVTKQSTMVA